MSLSAPASTTSASVDRHAAVFAALWALAHLAHLLRKADPSDPLVWAVLLAAVLVLDNPRSRARLALLTSSQLVYLYGNLPSTDNHLIIMGFVNLGLLAALLLTVRSHTGPEAVASAAGYMRLAVLLAYAAAAVAKLNRGFFDTELSCAVGMYGDARAVLDRRMALPELAPTLEAALPYVVAVTELAIPLLLIVPATRLTGIGVTVVFHWAMSLSPSATAIDFTIVLFALLFLFLPAQTADHTRERVRTLAGRLPAPGRLRRTPLLLALTAAGGALIAAEGAEITNISGNQNWLVLAPAAIVLGALLLDLAWRSHRERLAPPRLFPGVRTRREATGSGGTGPETTGPMTLHIAHLGLLLVLLLHAASPYLGGGTKAVYTMYSNMQTESGQSNHLFLPRLPVATAQDDLVAVLGSSNSRLDRIGGDGNLLSWHELRRELAEDPDASIRYRRGGTVVAHEHARENPELVTREVAHRFIAHRVVDPAEPGCRW